MNIDIKNLTCIKCAFCKQALVPDLKQEYAPGRRRRRIDGFICCIRPPVANGGCPTVRPLHGCALWTSATGTQPLRKLIELGMSETQQAGGAE